MKRSVLVIDDNPLDLKVFEAALSKHGFEVITLDNSSKALDYVLKYKPSFVILDLYMPDQDGFEVCTLLKTHPETRNIPVMFVTSSDDIEDASRSIHMGVIDYFHKPVSTEKLVEHIVRHDVITRISEILSPLKTEMRSFCEKYKDGI